MARQQDHRTPDLRGWPRTQPLEMGQFRFGHPAQPDAGPAPAAGAPVQRFGVWLAEHDTSYRWDYRHFREMQSALDDLTAGRQRRLYFQVPIRHGKTEHNTVRYAAYRLALNPRTRILVCSYADRMAQRFSRQIRRLAILLGVAMSTERNAASEWETAAGGGVMAVGAGAGVASVNADLILIDDPIGSRDEAESLAHRDRVWDWLTNDILARCEPHTGVCMTMSRWHQDDPAGRLRDQQSARWRIIDFPAEAESDDALGRAEGEPLWPELRPSTWLEEKREELGAYGFAALLQGRPRPREGGMFKWAWWQLIDAVPESGRMVRYWDLAGTEPKGKGHDPDFSAGALACRMPDQRTALVEVQRARKSIAARDTWLLDLARSDRDTYGGRVVWWIETEAGIAGADRTAELVRRIQATGLACYTEHPTGKKVMRAEPLASAAEAGNVVLCPGEWRDPFRAEAADFPNGKHDDQIDAAAGALVHLATPTASLIVGTF